MDVTPAAYGHAMDSQPSESQRPEPRRPEPQRPAAEQEVLPLEPAAESPIPFALTARARRVVAPATLPDLTVVRGPSDGDEPDPGTDTRPARARALRRAGLGYTAIAAELGLDEGAVRGWCRSVAAARPGTSGHPATPDAAAGTTPGMGHRASRVREPDDAELAQVTRQAAARATERLRDEPAFARDAGLVVGAAEIDRHGVTVRSGNRRLLAAVLRALGRWAELDPRRVRVVLGLAPDVAADILVHRWADELDLARERVTHTRTRDARDPAPRATIRIADEHLAATLAGWQHALLALAADQASASRAAGGRHRPGAWAGAPADGA